MKRWSAFLLVLTMLLGLTSCFREPALPPDATPPVAEPVTEPATEPATEPVTEHLPVLTSLSLRFSSVTFRVGERITPAVSFAPADAAVSVLWESSDPAVALVTEDGTVTAVSEGECTVTVTADTLSASIAVSVVGDDAPVRIDGVLIVNKTYPLPENYALGRDEEAFLQLCALFADAKAQGYALKVASSYRSFADQRYIYNNYVAESGRDAADRFSARPGHSEHQSGLTFDVNHPESNQLLASFGDSPVGKWIAEHCHEYGFIIRYPKEKEAVTGYMYEPWHLRYVGTEMAAAIFESGLCLEEYFGISSAYGE